MLLQTLDILAGIAMLCAVVILPKDQKSGWGVALIWFLIAMACKYL